MEAYFVTRLAFSLAPYLSTSTDVWKAKRELDELLRGLKKGAMDDREEWCLQRVESTLGFAGGRFFVEEVFGGARPHSDLDMRDSRNVDALYRRLPGESHQSYHRYVRNISS